MSAQLSGAVRSALGELRTKETSAPTPQEEFLQATVEFKRISEEIRRFADSARSEIKETGDLSRATKDKVDQALSKQSEIQARLLEVEQKLARAADDVRDTKAQTPGELFVASDEFKQLQSAGRGTARLSVKAITSLTPASGGLLIQPARLPLQTLPPRPYRVRDLLAPGRTSSNAIAYPREVAHVNNAAIVVEGALKPETNVTFQEVITPVRTIAHWLPASKQILDDVPYLQSFIDNILRDGLLEVEDLQLLKGSGTGNDLNGILTSAAAYVAPITIPGTPTRIDILRLALLQASLTRHQPTGIVLHPADWAAVELTKDTTGKYIFTDPVTDGSRVLWGRPVVETVAMDAGDFLVGPFRSGAQVLDREDANVQVSTEDRDNFIRNMVTIRAEERLALVNYTPAAFITGSFA